MFQMPSQEEFDAMHDAAFCDWWDVWFAAQMQQADNEDEVERAEQVMRQAFDRRFSAE